MEKNYANRLARRVVRDDDDFTQAEIDALIQRAMAIATERRIPLSSAMLIARDEDDQQVRQAQKTKRQ